MTKTVWMALLVFGMSLAATGAEPRASTAQTQPTSTRGAAGAKELSLDLGNKVTMRLVRIPAGKFLMGSPETEKDRNKDEVQHEATISKPFYMGVYEVTVDQFAAFLKDTAQEHDEPNFKQAGDHPVVNVSWDDAQVFCMWLSKKTGKTVRLPTEAEWEYACRAGTKTRFGFGDKDTDLGDYAWYADNSMDKDKGAKMTHSVGQKKPNAWGLYDMHGNVWEWCSDWYGEYDGQSPPNDPPGPTSGFSRVLRGGSWDYYAGYCRSADRFGTRPGYRVTHVGFRIASGTP